MEKAGVNADSSGMTVTDRGMQMGDDMFFSILLLALTGSGPFSATETIGDEAIMHSPDALKTPLLKEENPVKIVRDDSDEMLVTLSSSHCHLITSQQEDGRSEGLPSIPPPQIEKTGRGMVEVDWGFFDEHPMPLRATRGNPVPDAVILSEGKNLIDQDHLILRSAIAGIRMTNQKGGAEGIPEEILKQAQDDHVNRMAICNDRHTNVSPVEVKRNDNPHIYMFSGNMAPADDKQKISVGLPGEGGNQQDNHDNNSHFKGGNNWLGHSDTITSSIKDQASVHGESRGESRVQPFHIYRYTDQENIMRQISQRLIHTLSSGTHTAKIRLKPDELGEMSMDISVMDKNIKAIITVENYAVKETIETNLNRLEEELKNQGLKIEEFAVEMRDGRSGERYMQEHSRENAMTKRGVSRMLADNSMGENDLNTAVGLDSGSISIFV